MAIHIPSKNQMKIYFNVSSDCIKCFVKPIKKSYFSVIKFSVTWKVLFVSFKNKYFETNNFTF